MTPTLGMAVLREAEISAFTPEAFYTVHLQTPDFEVTGERLKDKQTAAEAVGACLAESRLKVESVERKEKTEKAPALYDLTTLQRDANRILGFTAQQTLDYTQSLYEKKLVTYHRTDSRYLTEDMDTALPDWLNATPTLTA